MRETRSRTQRVPLQTISALNGDEELKTGADNKSKVKTKDGRVKREATPLRKNNSNHCQPFKTDGGDPVAADCLSSTTNLPLKQDALGQDKPLATMSWSPSKSRKRPSSPGKTIPPNKAVKVEQKDQEEESSDSEEELDYEAMRERNLRDNEAFFTSLGIRKAKEELQSSVRKYPKASQRREPKKKEVLPRRKSLRIQRIDPTGAPLPPEPEPEPVVNEHPRVPAGPLNMLDAIENEIEDHITFRTSVVSITANSYPYQPLSSDLSSFVSDMRKMRITTKAKACKDRLFSVAVHPTTDKVLAMAGDKWGRLGFWDISAKDQERSVVTYRPHSRPVGHIVVPPKNPLTVYTCSYDSTLRCCHIEKGVFEELYSVPEEDDDLFRSFDFLSPTSMLLAQFRGDIAVLDTRTLGQKAEKVYNVCDKYLRTVSIHPTNNNFFCTASSDMRMCVWDLRKLSAKGNKPLHTMTHGRAVSSAYFSPITGSRILTCSADNTLNVFSCSSSCGEVSRSKSISHNNHTGRWLTPFRSVWHPARDDVFFVGSMKTPRRMEAFGADGRLLHEFEGDVLSSVCSVVQFHPSQNILVGGNSSGYIFPFM